MEYPFPLFESFEISLSYKFLFSLKILLELSVDPSLITTISCLPKLEFNSLSDCKDFSKVFSSL